MGIWSSIGKGLKGAAKFLGKGIGFVGRGIGKGFKVLKKAVFGVGAALGATASFLGLGRKVEAEGKDAQRGIESAASEGDRKVEGVKAETKKMADAPPPRPDPEAEHDKREAKAGGEAAKHKLDAMEADLRVMDKLSAHTAEILRRYGSHAAKDMVAGMDTRRPNVTSGMDAGVLMGEQIRLMYEQKVNHKHGIFNVLSMIGANNELLGVLSDQLRLIHAQGVTDANYDVIKAKVMETLATKAVADSVKANALTDKNDAAVQAALDELVALQKEGNASQESGTRPLLKKVGLGMVAGLAGLAGLMMASKYLGRGDDDSGADSDKEDDDKAWTWPWEDDAPSERDDEEDRKNEDYIKDDGSLMSVEERNRVDEAKSDAKLTGGVSAAATTIEGLNAIKKGKAAASATKAVGGVAAKVAGNAALAEARKKFLKSLGPKAMKAVGMKLAAKLGMKAAAKTLGRKIPIVGTLFGLGEAAYRAFKGDYTGAALALGSGAASLLHIADAVTGPGGSIAAVSLGLLADGALAMHDYNKAMEELKSTGHTDMLDDDELDDILIPPTEQEMREAEEAEKKVDAEMSEKTGVGDLSQEGGRSSVESAPVPDAGHEDASRPPAPPPKQEGGGFWDKLKGVVDYGKMITNPGAYMAEKAMDSAMSSDGGVWAKVKGFAAGAARSLMGPMFSSSSPAPSSSPGSHEVAHGGTGIWMGYGANGTPGDGEGVGDLSECRSYPPETMERITNFEAHPPNEIDENGPFKNDVEGMIKDLVGMQGTIKYSMEQRDIDKGIGDCSTFTKWAMKKYFGIDIGNNCDMQLGGSRGTVVDYSGAGISGETSGARGPNMAVLKPGDLIYYSSSRRPWNAGRPFRIAHVEMYIGNGKVIGQTTTKGKGKGSDPKGPWVHDINDPNLGTFLAAKRYIGQTESSAKYAVDPESVSAQQSNVPPQTQAQASSTQYGTNDTQGKGSTSFSSIIETGLNAIRDYVPSNASTPVPTHTPSSSASNGSTPPQGSSPADTRASQGSSPVSIDNSTVTKGGDTYITNNNTTNIYTHEDGRGDSELS